MDPISDLLVRVRNAQMKFKDKVDVPASNLKLEILRSLKEEGFIASFKPMMMEKRQGVVRVFLKYTPSRQPVIQGMKRVSRPGRRLYRSYHDIPRVREGFGVTLLSTSQGVLTDQEARRKKVGGEVLLQVW